MTGKYTRDNINRERYERELTALRRVLGEPVVSAPQTAVELTELEKLVLRYPEHARWFVAALPPPP